MILLSVVSKAISLVPKNDPAVVKLCEPVIAAFFTIWHGENSKLGVNIAVARVEVVHASDKL